MARRVSVPHSFTCQPPSPGCTALSQVTQFLACAQNLSDIFHWSSSDDEEKVRAGTLCTISDAKAKFLGTADGKLWASAKIPSKKVLEGMPKLLWAVNGGMNKQWLKERGIEKPRDREKVKAVHFYRENVKQAEWLQAYNKAHPR